MKYLLTTLLCVVLGYACTAQTTIAAKDAPQHIGDTVTICEKVYSTKLMDNTNMTLLNLGGNYPNQLLTIMIPPADRDKFKQPEIALKGKTICVTGKLVNYRDKPEIVVTDPAQITIK